MACVMKSKLFFSFNVHLLWILLVFLLNYRKRRWVSVFWNRGSLNQRVNLCCVPLISDGGAKRHKVYTGSGNRGPVQAIEALRPVREIDLVFLAPECL